MKVKMIRQTSIKGKDVMIGESIEVDDAMGQFLINKGKAEIATNKFKKKTKK